MSVIVNSANKNGKHSNELFVKGAAECVLSRCSHILLPDGSLTTLDATRRKAVSEAVSDMATHALRCLACATRSLQGTPLGSFDGSHGHAAFPQLQDLSQYEAIESGLTFVGLLGLQDPPRPEVAQAIQECTLAGVRVIVITGALFRKRPIAISCLSHLECHNGFCKEQATELLDVYTVTSSNSTCACTDFTDSPASLVLLHQLTHHHCQAARRRR